MGTDSGARPDPLALFRTPEHCWPHSHDEALAFQGLKNQFAEIHLIRPEPRGLGNCESQSWHFKKICPGSGHCVRECFIPMVGRVQFTNGNDAHVGIVAGACDH